MCACVFSVCTKRAYETDARCPCICLCDAYTLSLTHILFILFSFFARFRIFRVRIRTRSCFFCVCLILLLLHFLFIWTVYSHSSMTNTCNDRTVVIYHTHWQALAWIRYLSFITKENLITFGREIVVCVLFSSRCVCLFCFVSLACVVALRCVVQRAQMSRLSDIKNSQRIKMKRVFDYSQCMWKHIIWLNLFILFDNKMRTVLFFSRVKCLNNWD